MPQRGSAQAQPVWCLITSSRLTNSFSKIGGDGTRTSAALAAVHALRRCTVQCSVCHAESHNLREYSRSALDLQNRKTIQTQYLCGVCRIVLLINPKLAAARAQEAVQMASRLSRAA